MGLVSKIISRPANFVSSRKGVKEEEGGREGGKEEEGGRE